MAKLRLKMAIICLISHKIAYGIDKIQTHIPLIPESLFLPLHTFVLHQFSFSSPHPSSSPHTLVVLNYKFTFSGKL